MKKKRLLKNRLHFKLARNQRGKFFTLTPNASKKKVIFEHILKCIRYHAPKTYSIINCQILKNSGLIPDLPVFLEENISKEKLKIHQEILKQEEYNLIIFVSNFKQLKKYKKYAKKYKTIKILKKNNLNNILKANLYRANINYPSGKLIFVTKDEGINLQDFKIKEFYENYNLVENYFNSQFNIKIIKNKTKNTAVLIKMSNLTGKNNVLNFSYTLNLTKSRLNYYNFKIYRNYIEIINVLSGKKQSFFSTIKPKNICISQIENLPNSNKPCLNLKYQINFKPNEEKSIQLSFGEDVGDSTFFDNQQQLLNLFNLKIETPNSALNHMFNVQLPRIITLEGTEETKSIYFNIDEILKNYKDKNISAYQCFVSLKNAFLTQKENLYEINPIFFANYQLKLYFENICKNIHICQGERNCLTIDEVKYYNTRTLSIDSILKSEKDIQIVFEKIL